MSEYIGESYTNQHTSCQDLLCTVNTQHNCAKSKCGPTSHRPIYQERHQTQERRSIIEHNVNPDNRVLNTAQMRDVIYLQKYRLSSESLDADTVIHQSAANELQAARQKAAEDAAASGVGAAGQPQRGRGHGTAGQPQCGRGRGMAAGQPQQERGRGTADGRGRGRARGQVLGPSVISTESGHSTQLTS